jgi:hypothetical protein
MATKAFEAFRERLKAKPLYFWSNGKNTAAEIKAHTRCADHLVLGEEGRKLTAREAWNYNLKCDLCKHPRT